MARALAIAALVLVFGGVSHAWAGEIRSSPGQTTENLVVPGADEDFSAYRVDADVFGWNRDYSELACLGMELKRRPDSSQIGEAFLLTFPVETIEPNHNVHVLFISHGATPHNPLPLYDVRDRIWSIDEIYQRLWPKRPKRKRPQGAMKVELIWDKVEVSRNVCQPAVGFVMHWKGTMRFQPHLVLDDVRVSCPLLRLTDNRIYWGKRDVAAAMPRFDFSTDPKHEQSFRHPVSALWRRGRALEFVLRGPDGDSLEIVDARKALESFGKVRIEEHENAAHGVLAKSELEILARRIAWSLHLPLLPGEPPSGDVHITLGGKREVTGDPRGKPAPALLSPQGRRKAR